MATGPKKFMLTCPHCKGKMFILPDMAGREIICAECAKKIKVPAHVAPERAAQKTAAPKPKTKPAANRVDVENGMSAQFAKRTKDVKRAAQQKAAKAARPRVCPDEATKGKPAPAQTPPSKPIDTRKKKPGGAKSSSRACPHCGSVVPKSAAVCPFCSKPLRKKGSAVCPHCNSVIPKRAIICPFCDQQVHAPPKRTAMERFLEAIKPSNLFAGYSITGFAAVFHFLLFGYFTMAAAAILWISYFFGFLKKLARGQFKGGVKFIAIGSFVAFVLWVIGKFLYDTGNELRVWNRWAKWRSVIAEAVFAVGGLFLGVNYILVSRNPRGAKTFVEQIFGPRTPAFFKSWHLQIALFLLLGVTAVVAVVGIALVDAGKFPESVKKASAKTCTTKRMKTNTTSLFPL